MTAVGVTGLHVDGVEIEWIRESTVRHSVTTRVRASSRADRAYVRFNCASLTPELAEAALFGHTRGAFTGSVKERAGLFRVVATLSLRIVHRVTTSQFGDT